MTPAGVTVNATQVTVQGAGVTKVTGGVVQIGGGGACKPIARVGDPVVGSVSGSVVMGAVSTGDPTALAC